MTTQMTKLRKVSGGFAAIALSLSLVACGDDTESAQDSANTPSSPDTTATAVSSAAFPVTIDTALGAVEIEEKPERVVTLGWGSTEAALALGVTPVGMRDMSSDTDSDEGILPWVKEELGSETPELIESTSKEIPFEEIAALEPDAILAVQSGLTEEQYDKLSDIAPTVGYAEEAWQTPWQQQTMMVGKALGMPEKAADLVEEAESKIARVKDEHPEFQGKTIAATGAPTTDGLAFYFAEDPRVNLLANLGFTPMPELDELQAKADPGRWATIVSWENIQDYQPDVMTTWFLDEDTQSEIEGNALFQDLKPVETGAYVPMLDPELVFGVSSPNVLNIDWVLDNYVPLLSDAAKSAEESA